MHASCVLPRGHMADVFAPHRFEVFECARKVALVGIPVFFVNDTLEQLMLGLIVCFLSFGVFQWFKPYRDRSDNTLQSLCLMEIFVRSGTPHISLFTPSLIPSCAVCFTQQGDPRPPGRHESSA